MKKACGLSDYFQKAHNGKIEILTKVSKITFKLLRDEFSLHTDTDCDLVNIAAIK